MKAPTTSPPENYLPMLNLLFDLEDMRENESNPKAMQAILIMGFEVYGVTELTDYAKRIGKGELLNSIIQQKQTVNA